MLNSVTADASWHPKSDRKAYIVWMALIWAGMVKIALVLPVSAIAMPLALMGAAGIFANAVLMALNLIPLPPLDGGRIAVSILPHRYAYMLARIEPYGLFILLGLVATGLLGVIIGPFYQGIEQGLMHLLDIIP